MNITITAGIFLQTKKKNDQNQKIVIYLPDSFSPCVQVCLSGALPGQPVQRSTRLMAFMYCG